MSVNTYTANTIIQSALINADLSGLANGSNDTATNSMSTFRSEAVANFVASGCALTGDSVGVNRNASQSSGVIYIAGVRLTVAAVSGRTYTASKDTYVDLNNSGVQVYTEVANNAASPALAASSIRCGIVVTGATTIAASTSIGQGGLLNTLPTISSQILRGFDTLGNLIYPTGPASPNKTQSNYAFRVHLASVTNFATSATRIPFDTKDFDKGNNVDIATNKGRFTATVAGLYQFNGRSNTGQASGGHVVQVYLYRNGVEYSDGSSVDTVGGTGYLNASNVSDLIQLGVGDYVELFAVADAVLSMNLNAATFFSGFMVST